jgi:osmotically-inducible protein OsmY
MRVILDNEIEKAVHDRLQRVGANMDKIRATVSEGRVKLMGYLEFETQRRTFLKVVSAVEGVERVDDQMLVEMKKKK